MSVQSTEDGRGLQPGNRVRVVSTPGGSGPLQVLGVNPVQFGSLYEDEVDGRCLIVLDIGLHLQVPESWLGSTRMPAYGIDHLGYPHTIIKHWGCVLSPVALISCAQDLVSDSFNNVRERLADAGTHLRRGEFFPGGPTVGMLETLHGRFSAPVEQRLIDHGSCDEMLALSLGILGLYQVKRALESVHCVELTFPDGFSPEDLAC